MAFFDLLWLASLMLGVAYAQRTNTTATCGSDFDWMSNGAPRNQSPCLVAAYLQGACGSGAWTVPALPSEQVQQSYLPPDATTSNICTCSAAVYNLMSACAACQGGGWLLFAPWSLACQSANLLSLPASFPSTIPIPSNTSVPDYALVDPRAWSGGGFNVTEARGVALGAPPPSYTLTTSSSGSSTTSSTSTSTISSSTTMVSSNQPSHQDNTGAIVGGVVGGLLGAALVIVILIWLLCGKRLQNRFGAREPPSTGQDILGRAFATPTQPPTLTSIVIPVPMRPYPLKNGFQSWMSGSTTGSQAADNNPVTVSPKPLAHRQNSNNVHNFGQANEAEGVGVQFAQEPTIRRTNTTSSVAHALFRRVTSPLRWRSHRTTSSASIGSGTAMTSIPADSEAGHSSRDVSRQDTTRRIAEPVPFIMPSHTEVPIMDISGGTAPGQHETDYTQYYGMSAAEEKRRLNPPAYTTPPVTMSRNQPPSQMMERMAPDHSTSFVDLISAGATAGSRSNDDLGASVQPPAPNPTRYRPGSDPLSLPSNLVLSSPMEFRSQDASSGMLDASPVVARQMPPNLRFMVANPSRDVEM